MSEVNAWPIGAVLLLGAALASVAGLTSVSYPNTDGPAVVQLARNDMGTLTVQASLNGSRPDQFILDTGASAVSIPSRIASRLTAEGRLSPDDFVKPIDTVLADNSEKPGRLYRLKSVTVGGYTAYNVPCVVGGDNSAPLLGQSFLKRTGSWSIDNKRDTLTLVS